MAILFFRLMVQRRFKRQSNYLEAGTYSFSDTVLIAEGNNGTSSNYKKIAAAGDGQPVLDFSQANPPLTATGTGSSLAVQDYRSIINLWDAGPTITRSMDLRIIAIQATSR
jgi:hypothetical protein